MKQKRPATCHLATAPLFSTTRRSTKPGRSPKNANLFSNAGTERFIHDWRKTEVFLSVRDARIHENDPLLGIVYLPLAELFHKRSQFKDTFPLVGGIGFGRVRVSMVFRSV